MFFHLFFKSGKKNISFFSRVLFSFHARSLQFFSRTLFCFFTHVNSKKFSRRLFAFHGHFLRIFHGHFRFSRTETWKFSRREIWFSRGKKKNTAPPYLGPKSEIMGSPRDIYNHPRNHWKISGNMLKVDFTRQKIVWIPSRYKQPLPPHPPGVKMCKERGGVFRMNFTVVISFVSDK